MHLGEFSRRILSANSLGEFSRPLAQLLKRFLMRADTNGEIAHCLKEIGVLHNVEELRQARSREIRRCRQRRRHRRALVI